MELSRLRSYDEFDKYVEPSPPSVDHGQHQRPVGSAASAGQLPRMYLGV